MTAPPPTAHSTTPPKQTSDSKAHERTIPVLVETGEESRFSLGDSKALEYLAQHGYVVIKSVLDEKNITEAKDLCWKWLEAETSMRRGKPDTWTDYNFPDGMSEKGIVWHNSGQSPFAWYVREKAADAFRWVWAEKDLVTSMDGINLFRPQLKYITEGSWWHTDQDPVATKDLNRQCVQGFVSLLPANGTTGGLAVIDGSVKHFDKWHLTYPNGFFRVPRHDRYLHDAVQGGRAKLVTCKAGDLVLWDSRTIHCNHPRWLSGDAQRGGAGAKPFASEAKSATPVSQPKSMSSRAEGRDGSEKGTTTTKERKNSAADSLSSPPAEMLRIVSYVCMIPRKEITKDVAEARLEAVAHGFTLGHDPRRAGRLGRRPGRELENCPVEKRLNANQAKLV